VRLYDELCRLLREAGKSLREERRRRKNQEDDDERERRTRDALRLTSEPADRATGSALRMPRRDTEDTGAAEVESAMAGAFADSAGMPKSSAIHEVTTAVSLQTGAAIKELELVEQELRKSGYLPSDDAK